MNPTYDIGSFGRWEFSIKKKTLYGMKVTDFNVEGAMVIDTDGKNILLQGTDGVDYLVTKRRVKSFEPMTNVMI